MPRECCAETASSPPAGAPIFLVGVPRSGTTLLAAMLGSHGHIACGPETHFFSRLKRAQLVRACRDSAWPKRAIALLSSLKVGSCSVAESFGFSATELLEYLRHRQPSVQSMLQALTEQFAERLNKPRWAEKTPAHQRAVQAIREFYPRSPIIRIVRDPRDVALSLSRNLPWASRQLLPNLYLWRQYEDCSRDFFATDWNSLTVRYEDLVASPAEVLSKVSAFLGEEFQPQMLAPARVAHQVQTPVELWKENVSRPVDASKANGWKRRLAERDVRMADFVCAEGILRHGYELRFQATSAVRFHPSGQWTLEHFGSLFYAAAGQGIRLLPAGLRQRGSVPPRDHSGSELLVLGLSRKGRNTAYRIGNALLDRLELRKFLRGGGVVTWIREDEAAARGSEDVSHFLRHLLLRTLARPVSGRAWLASLARNGTAKRTQLGFLHVGDPRHGVCRYGRLLSQELQRRSDVVVHDVHVSLAGSAASNCRNMWLAARQLRAVDLVHIQHGRLLWGRGWSSWLKVTVFILLLRRPLAVTFHDLYVSRLDRKVLVDAKRWLQAVRAFATNTTADRASPPNASVRARVSWNRLRLEGVADRLVLRRLSTKASLSLVCTREEAARLNAFARVANVMQIPHFVEERALLPDRIQARRDLRLQEDCVLVLLGFIHPRKGHKLLLQALPKLPEEVRLIFAGSGAPGQEGFLTELVQLARQQGTVQRLTITGYLPEPELEKILVAADLAICPFRQMSASGSLATWISAARPILAYDLPQIRELNRLSPGAITTFARYDAACLAQAIQNKLALIRSAARIPDPAVLNLRNLLSLPAVAVQHLSGYLQAIGSSGVVTGALQATHERHNKRV